MIPFIFSSISTAVLRPLLRRQICKVSINPRNVCTLLETSLECWSCIQSGKSTASSSKISMLRIRGRCRRKKGEKKNSWKTREIRVDYPIISRNGSNLERVRSSHPLVPIYPLYRYSKPRHDPSTCTAMRYPAQRKRGRTRSFSNNGTDKEICQIRIYLFLAERDKTLLNFDPSNERVNRWTSKVTVCFV